MERNENGRFVKGHTYIRSPNEKSKGHSAWRKNKDFLKNICNTNNFPKDQSGNKNPFYGKKHSIESLRKIFSIRKPTSLEVWFDNFFKQNNLPYKYVGNGQFWIGRCNPDFINVNGSKIAIEVFSDFWHDYKYENERSDLFAKYGWKVVFFRFKGHDDRKPNEQMLFDKIKEMEEAYARQAS